MNVSTRAAAFRKLHERPGTFVVANPWDCGSARLLEIAGFEALASTSAGFAFSRGTTDKKLERDQVLQMLADINSVIQIPLSADLENGFGDSPEVVGETIRLAAEVGCVGGSIEDATGKPDSPYYDLGHAVERVRAAVESARALPFPFLVTARVEANPEIEMSLEEIVTRLRAFQDAGADVLFPARANRLEHIATIVRQVDRPVNIVVGFAGVVPTVAELASVGVKRVSIGGSLARAAYGVVRRAARQILDTGTFGHVDEAVPMPEMTRLFQ